MLCLETEPRTPYSVLADGTRFPSAAAAARQIEAQVQGRGIVTVGCTAFCFMVPPIETCAVGVPMCDRNIAHPLC